ncbi:MAG: hypothetical protein HYW02_02620 [Deltaproteobacteria bacterium]|nr:hypothetical protein [Deltaproteobacteria bacterium]MBI2500363.1 hypothetical protein [Deltaproteobacteria bacterium]MBI4196223.1 hypothetical protein [Deltaproteobacteria bacterium]
MILTYLHLAGLVISLGGGLFFVIGLYPSLRTFDDPSIRMRLLASSLRIFHPLFLFGLCLTFMTGALHLTDFKIALGSDYLPKIGSILLWKFGMTLLIFLIAGMQCFGMGLKFQRMVNGVVPGDLATQERYAKKIWRAQFANLIFLAITLWLGLMMSAIIHD